MFDIDSKLKNAWIGQLKRDWINANYYYFGDKMLSPAIDLLSSEITLGQWEGGNKRRLSISAFFIKSYSWQYVQETLHHEMAHQYVEEVLKITNAYPHGEAFKKICIERGFDPKARGDIHRYGQIINNSKGASRNHKILGKIEKLLSLAQSNNTHEAELAMTLAQELLLKHNISLGESDNNRNYIKQQIGEIGKTNPIRSLVGTILGKFFFVETLWAFGYDQRINKEGRILEIYGTPENVEMAEYVHDYLHRISEALWNEFKRRKGIKGNKHRRSFIYGLLNGFDKKLEAKKSDNQNKGLIWKGDPELTKFYRRRNPKITSMSSRYSTSCQNAFDSGLAKGKNLVIHKGIKNAGSGKVRLLN